MHLFTQPDLLAQIGAPRLSRFLSGFDDDLSSAKIFLSARELTNGNYFDSVAGFLRSTAALPGPLREAISAIEHLAEPENSERLNAALAPHIESMSIPRQA